VGPTIRGKGFRLRRELGIQYTLALPDDALSVCCCQTIIVSAKLCLDRTAELQKHFIGYGPASEDEIGPDCRKRIKISSDSSQLNYLTVYLNAGLLFVVLSVGVLPVDIDQASGHNTDDY